MSLADWTRCDPSVTLNSLLAYPATDEPQAAQKLEKLIIGYNLVTDEKTGEKASDLTV
jgi:hypothetical protein